MTVNTIKQLSIAAAVTSMVFIGCASPEGPGGAASRENVGYVWERAGVWSMGDAATAEVWQQWTSHFDSENLEGLLGLAHDSISIELNGNEQIDGVAAFEQRISNWFAAADVSMNAIWCVPIQYHEEDGTPDNGNWLLAGYEFTSIQGDTATFTDRHANVHIVDGKIRYAKIYTHEERSDVIRSVTLSVDMNNYTGEYNSVNVYGFFNDWCASCNEMTDEDGDGIYTAKVRATEGEMEYKFTLDGGVDLQEMFEAGAACTKTVDVYTNRLGQVESDTEFPTVCFNACQGCE